jgi:pSer/pThr/pTyr-binding forkhead associated (FHA) protein
LAAPALDAPAPAAPALAAPPPAAPAPDADAVLATLDILNVGPANGARFDLRAPLVHVGRGAHNDVRLSDESVSDSHAKLQRRDDGWYVLDIGSTNGTYVGGNRVEGERQLVGATDLRFGRVMTMFRVMGQPGDAAAKGTHEIVAAGSLDAARPIPAAAEKRGMPPWIWIVFGLLGVGAIVFVVTR